MSAKCFGLALRLFSSSFPEQAAWTSGCPSVSAWIHLAAPGGFEQHLLVKWDLQEEFSGLSSPWRPVGEAGAFLEVSELPQLCLAAAEPFSSARSATSLGGAPPVADGESRQKHQASELLAIQTSLWAAEGQAASLLWL